MHALTYKTLERIAQISGGVSYNPAVLAAQFASALIQPAPSLQQWINQLRQNQEPGENPAVWMNILLAELAEQKYSSPLTRAEVQTVTARDIEAMRPALWLDHSTANTNAQSTTAVSWGDRSGNRRTATVVSAPAVSRTARWNGKPYLTFSAGNYFTITELTAKEVFVVARPGSTGRQMLVSKGASFYFSSGGLGGGAARPLYAGGTQLGYQFGYQGQISTTAPQIFTLRIRDVGGLSSWAAPQQLLSFGFDGHEMLYQKEMNAAVLPAGITQIGGSYGGSGAFAGGMAAVLVFDRNLTGPERLAVMRYLAATYGIELPVRYRMVVLGDSIAAAQGVTPAESLIGRLLGYASTGLLDSTVWSGFSGAVGGTLTGDLIASNIHALDHFADGAVNLAVLWAGTNNNSLTTVEEALADMAEALAEVRARNGYTLLMAMLPTSGGNDAFRVPYNAGLAALAAADTEGTVLFFDGDTLAPDIYDSGAAGWAAKFQDGLHPNGTGFGYLAPLVAAEIEGFLDGKEPLEAYLSAL